MYNACAHTYIAGDPLPYGEISRVAFIGMRSEKLFRGWWDFEVRRDFEEIRYFKLMISSSSLARIKFCV